MKRLLLLSLVVANLPAAQMPPRKPMASLEGLPTELKGEILRFYPQPGGVLNLPALAQGLTNLAATSKALHAAINNPSNMLIILKSLPKAGAVVLAEGLRNMPGMKSNEVDAWLKSFKLEAGEELLNAVNVANPDINAVAKLLANPNINVNWGRKEEGHTALGVASKRGYIEIARLLIAAGANVNGITNDLKDTAIIEASRDGHAEIVKLLIATGANINARNEDGETALMWAAHKGLSEIVSILLAAGADPLIRKGTRTALDIARQYSMRGHIEDPRYGRVIKLLQDAERAQKERAARR